MIPKKENNKILSESYYIYDKEINCFLMTDIKSTRIDINKEERDQLLKVLDENNIRYTFLYYLNSKTHFIIFDTDNDFMLFKLKFSNNFSKEFINDIYYFYYNSYLLFKNRMINYIEDSKRNHSSYQVFTKSPKNDIIQTYGQF